MSARPMPEVDGVDVRHSFHDAAGLRMHVAEAGEGEPLVMLHGWPQHWWCWRALIPELSKRYRVICPDLRGFGWSDAPPSGYDKEQLTDDVIALMEEMELRDVRLVGHDWGGVAGFRICLRRPELVKRYLALNTAHPWIRIDLRTLAAAWRLWYQWLIAAPLLGQQLVQRVPPFLTLMQRHFGVVKSDAWGDEEVEVFASQFREPARARATVQTYRTVYTRDAFERSYSQMRLSTPTLFLYGAADGVIRPATLRGYEGHTDDMRVEAVEGCGHFIAEECPGIVIERALELFG